MFSPTQESRFPVYTGRRETFLDVYCRSWLQNIHRAKSLFRDRFTRPRKANIRTVMRLTNFSDYALRVLMYAGTQEDRLSTIEQTATVYGISRADLMKVANQLTPAGFLRPCAGNDPPVECAGEARNASCAEPAPFQPSHQNPSAVRLAGESSGIDATSSDISLARRAAVAGP